MYSDPVFWSQNPSFYRLRYILKVEESELSDPWSASGWEEWKTVSSGQIQTKGLGLALSLISSVNWVH